MHRLLPLLLFTPISVIPAYAQPATIRTHSDLIDFFHQWRTFAVPNVIDGIPDYSLEAMRLQHTGLSAFQDRLLGADTTGWSVSEQVDWFILWAEMNGLDFKHRVKRPWANDPAFYVWFYPSLTDVPEREAPNIHGAIEYAYFNQPLSDADAAAIAVRLRHAPELYEQARINLTGTGRDYWTSAERSLREQSEDLAALAESVHESHPDLAAAAEQAWTASDQFADWIAAQLPSKTGTSGIGRENYSWNLKNVHLIPFTWEEEVTLMKRELVRAHAALRLEEHRNRSLPRLTHMATPEEYDTRFNAAVDEYLEFLEREEIVPMKDYMEAALRARVGRYTPSEGLRGFFSEITYRDPLVMRTHDYHWIDLARLREEPHSSPIRQTPMLYNAFDSRAEGMATGMEEMMMHAGLFDDSPRTRELIWILLAQRAARGLGGLYQHGLKMTLQEAAEYASKWTPWDLLPADGATIQHEEQFYLQQPGYGTSYVIGKILIEELLAEYARQRGRAFVISDFTDALNDSGIIPVSLIYWEMTGDRTMLNRALGHE